MNNRILTSFATTDPRQAVEDCKRYLANSERMLAEARDPETRALAQFFIANATNNLMRWQAAADRQVPR